MVTGETGIPETQKQLSTSYAWQRNSVTPHERDVEQVLYASEAYPFCPILSVPVSEKSSASHCRYRFINPYYVLASSLFSESLFVSTHCAL